MCKGTDAGLAHRRAVNIACDDRIACVTGRLMADSPLLRPLPPPPPPRGKAMKCFGQHEKLVCAVGSLPLGHLDPSPTTVSPSRLPKVLLDHRAGGGEGLPRPPPPQVSQDG